MTSEENSPLTIERCRSLRSKYPNHFPVVLQGDFNINKPKMMINGDMNMSQVMTHIRAHNKLKKNEAYFLFINNTLLVQSSIMTDVYRQNRNLENGFLFIKIRKESTFG